MIELYKKISLLCIKTDRKKFYLLLVVAFFLAGFDMAGIALVAPLLSLLINPDILDSNQYFHAIYLYTGIDDKQLFIFYAGLAVFIFYIVANIYIVIANWLFIRFAQNQAYKISTKLFASYLYREYLYFTTHNTAELSRTIFQDVARFTDSILSPFLTLISRTASVIAILILLAFVNLQVTLLAGFVFGTCYSLFFLWNRNSLKTIGEKFTKYNNLRFRLVSEAFGGIKDCKIYNAEDYFIEAYKENTFLDSQNQTTRRTLLFIPRYLIESLAIGGLILFAVFSYLHGNSASLLNTLLVFAIAAYKIMPSIQAIYVSMGQIRTDSNALDLILKDIDNVENNEDIAKGEINQFVFKRAMQIDNLTFSYPNTSEAVFNKLSLEIKPRSIVGFAGRSGSGKSTLVDLILGLLHQQEGEITVDKQQVTQKNKVGWQKLLGYVPQSIYLVDASLAENIAFGVAKENIDYKQVRNAIVAAQLEDLVDNQLADGMDSFIGERGARLSGGQIQRIGIARALYRKPEVLILDEATSALDTITEDLIIDAICSLSNKITIIMIAHRLTTLKQCDAIFVMEKGEIIATGTYQELMDSNDYFQA